jgi:hypothetical protein
MEITRNDDGSLEVPVEPTRAEVEAAEAAGEAPPPVEALTLHPGEGGYDEALAELTLHEGTAVSTASGREQAMTVVHAVTDDETPVAEAVDGVDQEPVAEALKHVLVGGQPSVDAFAHEVAEAEGGEPVPAHQVSKVIDEVIQEIES